MRWYHQTRERWSSTGKRVVCREPQQRPDRARGRKTQYYSVGLVIRYLEVRLLSSSNAQDADREIVKVRISTKRVLDNLLNVVQAAVQTRFERHGVGVNAFAYDSFDV